MDCRTAKYIEDYLDGLLDDVAQARFEKHIESCRDCRKRMAKEQAFREALRSMPVPEPAPELAACFFERAASASTRDPRIGVSVFMRIAASILVIFALGFLFKANWRPDQPEWSEAIVQLNQSEEIRLVFNSKQDLANVTLRLEPPEGIELVGFENQREVVWKTDLIQGENLLVLPVIVRNWEGGSLIAELRHGNLNKQFGLRIKVIRPDGSRPGAGRFEGHMGSTKTL